MDFAPPHGPLLIVLVHVDVLVHVLVLVLDVVQIEHVDEHEHVYEHDLSRARARRRGI